MCVRYGVFLPLVTLRRNHGIHQHDCVEKIFYLPASSRNTGQLREKHIYVLLLLVMDTRYVRKRL